MPDLTGMADAQREVDRDNLQRDLARVLGRKWRYPKELYRDEVWRVVWSGEEHAAFKIEGWADEKSPGTEYRPYTAVDPITKYAGRAETVGVPNVAPAKPVPEAMLTISPSASSAERSEELADKFDKLECTGLTAIRLPGSPEENPELARYFEAPSVPDDNRSGPATGDPAPLATNRSKGIAKGAMAQSEDSDSFKPEFRS
jgi:hypothetical protein